MGVQLKVRALITPKLPRRCSKQKWDTPGVPKPAFGAEGEGLCSKPSNSAALHKVFTEREEGRTDVFLHLSYCTR